MRARVTDLLLNAAAGYPVLRALRRARDLARATDHEAVAGAVLERFRTRREVLGDDRIQGACLLEIGSGREFGLALLLAGLGARRVVNVEIEPYGFVHDAAFYRLLVERARAAGLRLSWPPDGLVEAEGGRACRHDGERIALHLGRSAVSIPEPDEAFDVTFSVSVLQHVRRHDLPAVARELYRVTRRGGHGYHRLDLTGMQRDNPFRQLCYDERAWAAMFDRRDTYTNRYRADDLERIFRGAGFEVRLDDVRMHADRALFEATRPGFAAEFAGRPVELLLAHSAMLVLTRPG